MRPAEESAASDHVTEKGREYRTSTTSSVAYATLLEKEDPAAMTPVKMSSSHHHHHHHAGIQSNATTVMRHGFEDLSGRASVDIDEEDDGDSSSSSSEVFNVSKRWPNDDYLDFIS